MSAAGRAAVATAGLWLCGGCARLAGIDEYAVGEPRVENPCGALEVPTATRCQLVGVRDCGEGFAPDQSGGCEPVLPAAPCDPGLAALAGSRNCLSMTVANCQTVDGFGIVTRPFGTTVYVKRDATGPGDGSKLRPFATVAAALDAVKGDVSLALAAGIFTESVVMRGRRVQIVGPCYENATIKGGTGAPVIAIGPGADGSRVERVALTGGTRGISVNAATGVEIQEIWVHDVDGHGITFEDTFDGSSAQPPEHVDGLASGTIQHSLVEHAREAGISAYGSELLIRETVVRDTRARLDGDGGDGIFAGPGVIYPSSDPTLWRRSNLTIERCVVERNQQAGIYAAASRMTVNETVIRDTQPDRDGQGRGIWINGLLTPIASHAASLEVSRSVIAGSHDVGVSVWNADATLTDTVVRDVGESEEAPCLGNGVRARYDQVQAIAKGVVVKAPSSSEHARPACTSRAARAAWTLRSFATRWRSRVAAASATVSRCIRRQQAKRQSTSHARASRRARARASPASAGA